MQAAEWISKDRKLILHMAFEGGFLEISGNKKRGSGIPRRGMLRD